MFNPLHWFRTKDQDVPLPKSYGEKSYEQSQQIPLDVMLISIVTTLLVIGVLMVYSTTIVFPDSGREVFKSAYFFLQRQCMYIGLAFIASLLILQVPMQWVERFSAYVFLGAVVLLFALIFIGVEEKHATRWFPLKFFNFQPSELMKLATALYISRVMVQSIERNKRSLRLIFPIAAAIVIVVGLLMWQPDLGAAALIVAITLAVLFLGGWSLGGVLSLVSIAIVLMGIMVFVTPWRLQRWIAFLDPFAEGIANTSGWQLKNAMIAAGSGGWFGQGIGGSLQKLHFVPEAHTDFIFSIFAEEFGFVGVVLIVSAFAWITWRCLYIGAKAIHLERFYNGLVAQTIGVGFGLQAILNMLVNLGLFPTKGVTLPLISYGGSSLIFTVISLAIVLRIDYENKMLNLGKQV